MRKAFNFYRSYWDVALKLPEKDRLKFLTAIIERQFFGKEPDLSGIVEFAYISQKHSIDRQVAGYQAQKGDVLHLQKVLAKDLAKDLPKDLAKKIKGKYKGKIKGKYKGKGNIPSQTQKPRSTENLNT